MKSMVKSIAALAASAVIATTSLTAAATVAVQPFSGNKLVKDPNENIWTAEGGSIKTNDINIYSESFGLDYSTITIGVNDDKTKKQRSMLKVNSGYDGNYKWTRVTVNGKNGHSTKYSPQSEEYSYIATALADDVGDVTDGTYYSFLSDSTNPGTGFLERSIITVKEG